ncbi:type II toxin-antitoxin system RatA family toxin [Kaarinaea lacus]
MTSISKSALVPYHATEMFSLVDNIPAYSEFLPWCRSAEEVHRSEKVVEARLDISHSGISKSFSTRNTITESVQIDMELVEGPFKHLHGVWRFEQLGDVGSKVSLQLEFEFSSKILGMTFGPVFNKMASSLVDAFIQRAKTVYGNG